MSPATPEAVKGGPDERGAAPGRRESEDHADAIASQRVGITSRAIRSEAERGEVAKGAAGLGISFSAFVRQAALLAAHRFAEARRPKPPAGTPPESSPVPVPEPAERHLVKTFGSFDEYRRRDSLTHIGGEFRFDVAGD